MRGITKKLKRLLKIIRAGMLVVSWHLRNTSRIIRSLRRSYYIWSAGGLSALKLSILGKTRSLSDNELYSEWISAFDTFSADDVIKIRSHIDKLTYKPIFSIIMPTFNTDEKWLRKAIESVRNQMYSNWELCIADDASTRPGLRKTLKQYANLDDRIKIVFREKRGHLSED
ncbi:MAG: glycosyltransferase [Bdellovibrionota bacterium]